ncbi:iron transporter [Afifella sp. H1R]|uniref:iron transporter n=1 Tax=unclassified Afifella TaxID=2624128 RepID=UPI001F206044|nr:iron transporter [Afifella sp. H1R]MCF1503643.1 iron transporter [Afifella sp. H1R]
MIARCTKLLTAVVFAAGMASAAHAEFKEYPAGEAKEMANMEIAAVYLSPIDMEPRGIDLPADQADIHIEADIHATQGNPNGFGAGEWIPYLTIGYTLENLDTGKVTSGNLMPMVAIDGPHYGSNIKMSGPGNYRLSYHIDPPSRQGFGRHTDEDTGVGRWFEPLDVEYEFSFVPLKD